MGAGISMPKLANTITVDDASTTKMLNKITIIANSARFRK